MVLTSLFAALLISPQAGRVQLDVETYYSYPNLFEMKDATNVHGVHFKVVTGTYQELSKKIQAFGKLPPTGQNSQQIQNGEATVLSQTYIARTGQKMTDRIAVRPKVGTDGVDLEIGIAPRQMRQDTLELPVKAHLADGQVAAIVLKRYDRLNTMRVFVLGVRTSGQ